MGNLREQEIRWATDQEEEIKGQEVRGQKIKQIAIQEA
jgi:hypothetical protein